MVRPSRLSWVVLALAAAVAARGRTPDEFALVLDAAERGDVVLAVGERGLVLRSGNAGRTWQAETVPAKGLLTCVASGPEGRWWVGGHDGLLLTASASGTGWTHAATGSLRPDDAVFGIHFVDTGEGRLWGAFGLLARLTPQGAAERIESPAGDVHFYAGAQGHEGWLLFGEAGSVLLWKDAGPEAETLSADAPSLHGALTLADGTVLAYGLRGRVLRLAQDGRWSEIQTPSRSLLAAGAEIAPGHLLLAGQSGPWLKSSDAGVTWTEVPAPVEGSVAKLLPLRDGALLVTGENGVRRLEKEQVP